MEVKTRVKKILKSRVVPALIGNIQPPKKSFLNKEKKTKHKCAPCFRSLRNKSMKFNFLRQFRVNENKETDKLFDFNAL